MGLNLGPAALAFAKVFNARQQGAAAGTQRAREDAKAAAQDAAEMERAKLDQFIKMQTAEKLRRDADPYGGRPRADFFKDLTDKATIEANAQAVARMRTQQQPTTTARVDPLSDAGIAAAARRAAAVKSAEAPFERERTATPRSEVPTDSERKAAYFLPNLEEAVRELKKYKPPTLLERATGSIPGVGNATISANSQLARAYADVIKEAHLRLTSGATITPGEEAIVEKTYIPNATDDPATVEAKFRRLDNLLAQARAQATRALPKDAPRAGQPGVPANAPNPWRP